MVYLIVVLVLGIALWMLASRPDPNHSFIVSLLPKLDFEGSQTTPAPGSRPDEGTDIHKTAA